MHSKEKPFKCDQCGYQSGSSTHMNFHTMAHREEKPFKCDKCNYSASQPSNLKSHKMLHNGERPFLCNQCAFSAARSLQLRRHVQTEFKCNKCDQVFHLLDDLKTHKMIHSGKTAIKCNQCEYFSAYPIVSKSIC